MGRSLTFYLSIQLALFKRHQVSLLSRLAVGSPLSECQAIERLWNKCLHQAVYLLGAFCFSVIQSVSALQPYLSSYEMCRRQTYTKFPASLLFSSVQFSPLTNRVVGGTWQTIQRRFSSSLFSRRPLWAVLAWAGISTLGCCPSIISSSDQGVARPPKCPEWWFWRWNHADFRLLTVAKRDS